MRTQAGNPRRTCSRPRSRPPALTACGGLKTRRTEIGWVWSRDGACFEREAAVRGGGLMEPCTGCLTKAVQAERRACLRVRASVIYFSVQLRVTGLSPAHARCDVCEFTCARHSTSAACCAAGCTLRVSRPELPMYRGAPPRAGPQPPPPPRLRLDARHVGACAVGRGEAAGVLEDEVLGLLVGADDVLR
jgi:hypothetical protein